MDAPATPQAFASSAYPSVPTVAVPPTPPKTSDQHEKLYSIGQAAQYLNVSIDTVRRWEKRGLISAVRTAGNLRRFSRRELESCRRELQNQDVLLPVGEAAKELSVSIQTLRRWDKSGRLKAHRDSQGQRVYPRKLLKEFIEQHRWSAQAPEQAIADNGQQLAVKLEETAVEQSNNAVANTAPSLPIEPTFKQDLQASITNAISAAEKEHTPLLPTAIASQNARQTPPKPVFADELKETLTNRLSEADTVMQAEQQQVTVLQKEQFTENLKTSIADQISQTDLMQQLEKRLTKRCQDIESQISQIQERLKSLSQNQQNQKQTTTVRLEDIRAAVRTQVSSITPGTFDQAGNLLRPPVEDHGTDSIGTATLPKGVIKMVIKTKAVTKQSVVLVTPITPCSVPLSVPVAIAQEGFAVTVVQPQTADITYQWMLIPVKQI